MTTLLRETSTSKTTDRTLDALNFDVQLDPVFYPNGEEIEGFKQIFRNDTGRCISMVSDKYKLVQHKQAITPVVDMLGKEGWKIHQSRIERSGAAAFVELRRLTAAVKVVGEPVGQRILMRNSYDRSSSLTLTFGAIVLRCLNGAVSPGAGSFGFNQQHTGDINDRLSHMLKGYAKIEADLGQRMIENYSKLDKAVPAEVGNEIIKRICGERKLGLVVPMWTRGIGRNGEQTAWNLYNGITQYLTHDYKGGWDLRERKNTQAYDMIAKYIQTGVLPKLEVEGN